MPDIALVDVDGTEVQVGDWLIGLRPGTIHAPGMRRLSGQVQSIRLPYLVVGQDWVIATYVYERNRYELTGTVGTWERGFEKWGLHVVQAPAEGTHG